MDLQLETGDNVELSLEAALDAYFSQETVTKVQCDHSACKQLRTMSKQLQMQSWPRVFVIF